MSIASVKEAADKAAETAWVATAQLMFARSKKFPDCEPNYKFYRRLAGLRGGDLSRTQDARYLDGRRVR